MIKVSHLKRLVWSIDAGYSARAIGSPRQIGLQYTGSSAPRSGDGPLRASGRSRGFCIGLKPQTNKATGQLEESVLEFRPAVDRRRSQPIRCDQAIVSEHEPAVYPRPHCRDPSPFAHDRSDAQPPQQLPGPARSRSPVSPSGSRSVSPAEGPGLPPTGGMLVRTMNCPSASLGVGRRCRRRQRNALDIGPAHDACSRFYRDPWGSGRVRSSPPSRAVAKGAWSSPSPVDPGQPRLEFGEQHLRGARLGPDANSVPAFENTPAVVLPQPQPSSAGRSPRRCRS